MRKDQRPRFGLRPWLAFFRLARARALSVRLDMAPKLSARLSQLPRHQRPSDIPIPATIARPAPRFRLTLSSTA